MFMDSGLSSTAMLIFQNMIVVQDFIAKFSAFIANQNKMTLFNMLWDVLNMWGSAKQRCCNLVKLKSTKLKATSTDTFRKD